jgi:single-strand DNA-binding protein
MYHKVILLGRLTGDPEMRYTPSGTAVTNFTVATSNQVSKASKSDCPEGWKESFNKRNWELTTFVRVTVWRKQAETCNEYLAKGRMVYIEGELNGQAENGAQNPRVWTGNDGVPHASYEVTARLIKFVGGSDSGNGSESSRDTSSNEPPPGYTEDEIPF